MVLFSKLTRLAIAGAICSFGGASIAAAQVSAELTARMEKEKEARKTCKVDICKAFAQPGAGAPIQCDVTKTWLKDEITSRVVGGSWVWGYGHVQCSIKLNLDRAAIAKAAGDATAEVAFSEHTLTCNVDDADAAKGQAFSAKISVTPVAKFEKGEAKSVALEPVKTEGSTVASAAVTSIMAADKVAGVVSKAAAGEINSFLYDKCKADGVEITKK